MNYWLDANIFITAKNSIYAFEINTSLWSWFDVQLRAKAVFAPEKVFAEIMDFKGEDLLRQWASTRKEMGLCVLPNKGVSQCLAKIADYLYTAEVMRKNKPESRYKHAQVAVFSRGADAFVIAHAMEDKGTVVTFESEKHPESCKIRIPDVCAHFGVPCIDLRQLLIILKAKL